MLKSDKKRVERAFCTGILIKLVRALKRLGGKFPSIVWVCIKTNNVEEELWSYTKLKIRFIYFVSLRNNPDHGTMKLAISIKKNIYTCLYPKHKNNYIHQATSPT